MTRSSYPLHHQHLQQHQESHLSYDSAQSDRSVSYSPASDDQSYLNNYFSVLTMSPAPNYVIPGSLLATLSRDNWKMLIPRPNSSLQQQPGYSPYTLEPESYSTDPLSLRSGASSRSFSQIPSPSSSTSSYSPGASSGVSSASGARSRTTSTSSSVNGYVRAPRHNLKDYSEEEKKQRIRGQNNKASKRYRSRKNFKINELTNQVSELEEIKKCNEIRVEKLEKTKIILKQAIIRLASSRVQELKPNRHTETCQHSNNFNSKLKIDT